MICTCTSTVDKLSARTVPIVDKSSVTAMMTIIITMFVHALPLPSPMFPAVPICCRMADSYEVIKNCLPALQSDLRVIGWFPVAEIRSLRFPIGE